MKVEALNQIDRDEARCMWRKYQEHRAYQSPHDEEIAAIYKRIAQGKTVIRALESIRAAGLNDDGHPKLAIARADQSRCYWHADRNRCVFSSERSAWTATRSNASKSKHIHMDWEGINTTRGPEATVPLIPVHLRPRRGLQNYHILWEAEWTKRYPVDPYLLRRFGGDAWLVVAAWDLTDVERAVMSSRVRS